MIVWCLCFLLQFLKSSSPLSLLQSDISCIPSHVMVHKIFYWHGLADCLFLLSAEKGCCHGSLLPKTVFRYDTCGWNPHCVVVDNVPGCNEVQFLNCRSIFFWKDPNNNDPIEGLIQTTLHRSLLTKRRSICFSLSARTCTMSSQPKERWVLLHKVNIPIL